MPILPRESDIYPPDLLTVNNTTLSERPWWVIYTMARREKDLMRRLLSQKIPFYAPLIKRRRRSPSGRWIESHVPLFAGYVFLCGDDHARHAALKTNCVARCLEVHDRVALVRDLRQIQQLVATGAPLTPEARIEAGARVRVRSGPMQGLEGVVIKRRGNDWLVVSVEFLQRGASVMLADFQLEPVS